MYVTFYSKAKRYNRHTYRRRTDVDDDRPTDKTREKEDAPQPARPGPTNRPTDRLTYRPTNISKGLELEVSASLGTTLRLDGWKTAGVAIHQRLRIGRRSKQILKAEALRIPKLV